MRRLALLLLLVLLPLFPQDPRPPPTGVVPANVGRRHYDFISPAQRMLLNYQQFGTRVGKFLESWEKWARVHNDIIQSPVYNRDSFLHEEKLWRGVIKRMNSLVKSRLSKGYLLAAEKMEEKGTVAAPPPTVPRSPPAPIIRTAAVSSYQTLRDYFAIQPVAGAFTARWAKWSTIHDQLMRAETYDYGLFEREAALWKRVTSQMDELERMRPKKAFLEPGKKR